MGAVPVIPKILEETDWQKHKGIIAKMLKGSHETGIGAQLKAFKTYWAKVAWDVVDPKQGPRAKPKNRQEFDDRMKEAKAKGPALVAGVRQETLKLKTFLEGAAKKLTNPLIKSTKAHVENMAKVAGDLATQVKDIDLRGFTEIEDEFKRTEETGRKMLGTWINSCETGIKAVRSKPTKAEYSAKLHQKVRGLGTAMSNIPEHRDFHDKKWKSLTGDGFVVGNNKVTDGPLLLKEISRLEGVLNEFKNVLKK